MHNRKGVIAYATIEDFRTGHQGWYGIAYKPDPDSPFKFSGSVTVSLHRRDVWAPLEPPIQVISAGLSEEEFVERLEHDMGGVSLKMLLKHKRGQGYRAVHVELLPSVEDRLREIQ